MNIGKAADWSENFPDTHTDVNGVFTPNLTWAQSIKLLRETFDIRKTKDNARVDLTILEHKPRQLKQYILNLSAHELGIL